MARSGQYATPESYLYFGWRHRISGAFTLGFSVDSAYSLPKFAKSPSYCYRLLRVVQANEKVLHFESRGILRQSNGTYAVQSYDEVVHPSSCLCCPEPVLPNPGAGRQIDCPDSEYRDFRSCAPDMAAHICNLTVRVDCRCLRESAAKRITPQNTAALCFVCACDCWTARRWTVCRTSPANARLPSRSSWR